MQISQVQLIGYRNFKNATINFEYKTLIIGANDVGKTNLLYALRILLDRNLSEQAIEPRDSDFYVHEETNEFSITIKFTNISDNVRAMFRGDVSDNDELYLRYEAIRDKKTNKKSFQILSGYDLDNLEENFKGKYTKALKIQYISSYRDLNAYIKRERRGLMEEAKEIREEHEVEQDQSMTSNIQTKIDEVNSEIANLNYIQKATEGIDGELKKLSFHHSNHELSFSIGGHDVQSFIDNAQLTSKVNGKKINIGGDGRNNQVFLALWSAKNNLDANPSITTIFAIEEPEAHLHPQQQRKIAEYLIETIDSQVILTSHSSHILSMFSPNAIVRLFVQKLETKAANNGCSQIIEGAFNNFGYRKSIISAEAFFANVVFLVEGASEVVFYTALGNSFIDLDKYNISILMVDGIGFKYYISILKALEIPYVLRTDNDIFKIPYSKPTKYRLAGIERAIDFVSDCPNLEKLKKVKSELLRNFEELELSEEIIEAANDFKEILDKKNIFIANTDLETDLVDSDCFEDLTQYFGGETDRGRIIKKMQKSKATFMFDFILKHSTCLKKIIPNEISIPLKRCELIAKKIID